MTDIQSLTGSILSTIGKHQILLMLVIMLLALYPLLLVIKRLLNSVAVKFFNKIEHKYPGLLKRRLLKYYFIHGYVALYLSFWVSLLTKNHILPENISEDILIIVTSIYVTLVFTAVLLLLVDILSDIYNTKSVSKRVPIGLHANIVKIIIVAVSALVIISYILHISITALFTSLGAAAAIITFIFKDAALGLVAGLQLTLLDLIRVGDQVSVPSYNADGIIEKITISTVVVRNSDKTVTTIPTSSLMSVAFKNWRYMHDSGARKLQRTVNIDVTSVRILGQDDLNRIKNSFSMRELDPSLTELFDLEEKITNLYLFRCYIECYLSRNKLLHNRQDYTIIVRTLNPSPSEGIPIEVYAYSKVTDFVQYEELQSKITEHMIASLKDFDLKFLVNIE